MKIIADYHTHTIYSHGKGTIRENVEAAIEKGLETIAITDHGPGHKLYGVSLDDLYEMRKEVDSLNREYKEIEILLGVEANIMDYDGNIDVNDELLELIDILLLGYHFGIVPKNLSSALRLYILNFFSNLFNLRPKNLIEKNTDAMIKAINKYPVDIITHPGSKAKLNIERLARECEKKDVCLEINSSHSQLSVEALKEALKTGVRFTIDSDAHSSERVGNFDKGLERVRKLNISSERIYNAR